MKVKEFIILFGVVGVINFSFFGWLYYSKSSDLFGQYSLREFECNQDLVRANKEIENLQEENSKLKELISEK